MNEFALIEKYFQQPAKMDEAVKVGIGDDAAVLNIPKDQQLVVCVDTIVSGTHFFYDAPPASIAHQALAVNLSDMAAMGAKPCWFTLSLTLPNNDSAWLKEFSEGLFALANQYQLSLIGGDTTRGKRISVTIQVLGITPPGLEILRSGAKAHDKIYVTGTLGDSGLGYLLAQGAIKISSNADQQYISNRYFYTEPRVSVGEQLRDLATSCIDISDGLAADLSHILTASKKGAIIYTEKLPLSLALKNSLDKKMAIEMALSYGDDYELCFTVPAERQIEVEQIVNACKVPCTCIGEITEMGGLQIIGDDNKPLHLDHLGWEHFTDEQK